MYYFLECLAFDSSSIFRNFAIQNPSIIMASTISPIDESSFSDASAFDPEALLNKPHHIQDEPVTEDVPATTIAQSSDEETAAEADVQEYTEPTRIQEPEVHESVTKRKTKAFPLARIMNLLLDSRSVRFVGLVMVVVACYAMIVSVSFFAHIGSDQSAVISGELDPEMIENTGGPLGAWLSQTLINDWLGIGSFLLIIWLGLTGLSLLKFYHTDFWGLTMRCLLSAVALSIVCGLVTFELASPFYWGGHHGHVLNERLVTFTGIWGAIGVSLIMTGMVVFLYLSELRKFFAILSSHVSVYVERNKAIRAERRRRKEEEAAAREAARQAAELEAIAREAARRAQEEAELAKQVIITTPPLANVGSSVANEMHQTVQTKPSPSVEPAVVQTNESKKANIPTKPVAQVTDRESKPDPKSCIEEESETVIEEPSLFNMSVKEEPVKDDYDLNTSLFAAPVAKPKTVAAVTEQPKYDPRAELSGYHFPSIDLLRPSNHKGPSVDKDEVEENKLRITNTLNNYGIPIRRIESTVGPTVTLYEIIPAEGVRIARIKHLEDDIALSLSALGIRIIAPIPGKGTIGIEVPNKDPQTVSMRSVIESEKYQSSKMELPMAMGCTISNEVFMADLCKMPHLLVAGATGMGKSVGLNAIVASLLYKKHPAELKFVLIDPKMVEFSLYAKLERHYLAKLPDEEEAIITDPSKVVATLNSLCVEMDNRYALLKDASMRNIKEYNERFTNHLLNPEKGHRFLPYIVVIVDEFADLIMTAGKEVETPIARIAQKARAVGIHMILATQRPSTNVITGIIKANFPGRIAFRVFQMVDSRTILDRPGANQLIGRGDMLFSNNGKIDRVQCAFIDTPEVNAICEAIDEQVGYDHAYELPEYVPENDSASGLASIGDRDPLFDECARLVVTTDTASTSSLQRRYSIGYNRAGKIMDQMEAAGIVGPSQGGKPRQVLVDPVTLERILENK